MLRINLFLIINDVVSPVRVEVNVHLFFQFLQRAFIIIFDFLDLKFFLVVVFDLMSDIKNVVEVFFCGIFD